MLRTCFFRASAFHNAWQALPSTYSGNHISLRLIGVPSERILKRRRRKFLPSNTNAGNEVITREWLEANFDGDLDNYENETDEIVEASMTAFEITAYNKQRWLRNFTSDHEFRRGIVMPARQLIFEEYNKASENASENTDEPSPEPN